VFVNIRGEDRRPEYYVVPSYHVARTGVIGHSAKGTWYSWHKKDGPEFSDNWSLFTPNEIAPDSCGAVRGRRGRRSLLR
jgi:hypothetical protein